MKIDNYHHRQLIWLISQIEALRNMVGFVVDGHNYIAGMKVIDIVVGEEEIGDPIVL